MDGEPVTIPERPVPTILPGWLAPGVVTLMTPWTIDTREHDVLKPERILDNNPERVAFMIVALGGGGAGTFLAPWADCANYPLAVMAANTPFIAGLQTYLGLITAEWYILPPARRSFRVVEFVLPTL